MVVDTTPPVAQLTLASEDPHLPAPYQYQEILPQDLDPAAVYDDSARTHSPVRIVAAGTALKIQDANLTEWSLEVSSLEDPSVSRPLLTGVQAINESRPIAIEQLRGLFRLRAKDRAGNQTLTAPQQFNDHRLFIPFAGAAETINQYWALPGQLMPRVRTFANATTDGQGATVISRVESGKYALGLNTTSGTHLTAFSVVYRTPSNLEITDTQNVTALGEAMVVWDANSAGNISEFELRAKDADGNPFQAHVKLDAPTSPRSTACVMTRGGEATMVSAIIGDDTTQPSDLLPGALWRFIAKDTGNVTDFEAGSASENTGKGIQVLQRIPTSHLSKCQYTVRFLGTLRNGSPLVDQLAVNLCKPQVTVTSNAVSLSESFRQEIRSAEVFVRGNDQRQDLVIARFGAFEGTSPSYPLDRSLFPSLGAYMLSARVTLADGSRVETVPSPDLDHSGLLNPGCMDEDKFTLPQGSLKLAPPVRDADAPLCSIHSPVVYTAELTGQGGSGQKLQALSAQLVTQQGESAGQLEVSGVTLGSADVKALVHIPTETLQPGSYKLRASATWSDGEVSYSEEQPVFVDRLVPSAVIQSPATTSRICPENSRGADGVIKRYLTVVGTVSDDHLESYELLVREPNGEPQQVSSAQFNPSAPSFFNGVLGTVDLTDRSDNLELLLSARDVSGSSSCAAPVAVQVATPPSISALSLSPALFSPDVDGSFDTTAINFYVDQDVSFTLTAEAGTQSHTVLQGQASHGSAALSWNGLLADGSHLADGDYPLRLRVTGACGMTAEASALVRLDTQAPVARIDFPVEGQALDGSVTVTGAATDVNMARYELSLGEGTAPTQYTPIVSAQTSASGVLGDVPLSNLPMGDYTLRLVAEDKAGHSQEVLRRFKHQPATLLRAASVVPTLVSPDGDGVLDTTSLNVTLAAPATVSATLLNAAGQPLRTLVQPTSLPASTSQLPLTDAVLGGLADGLYTVRVSADSGSGTEEIPAALEIDVSKPHVQFSSPVANSVRGAQLTVEGVIDDTHLESWTLTHIAPHESSGHVLASSNTVTSGILAVQSGLAEGTHQLVLKAIDRAGHSQEQSVSFTVDTTPPVVSFLSPTNGALLSGAPGPVDIRGHAQDAHLRSVSLEATTVKGTQTLFSGASLPPDGLIQRWAMDYESDGPAELRLVAEDAAGNTAESLLSLVLDSTPPVATLTGPRGATRGEGLAFSGSATDANLSKWELELGRGTSASDASFQQIASSSQPVTAGVLTTLTSVGDGSYVARLRVRDTAGNESVELASFTVDSIAPLPAPTLSATVQRPNTVALTWEPSPSSDVTTYDVLRATSNGSTVVIATVDANTHSYLDTGVPDGHFRYSVVARDAARNASNPSPEAQVEIDSTPPLVSWIAPTSGEQVRGTIELQGTAYSQSDFREYRVSIGAGSAPAAFTLLTHSLLPVSAGHLGELDAHGLPQGSVQTLRLEAEDLIGNVSEARVTFTVDNAPPAKPGLTRVLVSGSNVTASWTATAEEDLLGFVLFRDGAPLGNPGNTSPQDLRPYALPPESRSYTDTSVPDGTHTYYLVAIDRAGNISQPSQSLNARVETRAPVARITEPARLEQLRQDTWLVAQSDDQDIASIRFESRNTPTGAFALVGAEATHVPFTSRLPLSQFTGRIMELRAVAKDSSNKVDPSPASIHVLKEAIPSQPSASALVDGDEVQLSWTDTNPTGLLTGFELSADGRTLTQAPYRWPGTTSATSSSDSTPNSAYDDAGTSTAWTPGPTLPQAWTLTLTDPVLLRGVSLTAASRSHLRLEAQIDNFWVPLVSDVETNDSTMTQPLDRPVEVKAIRVTFLSKIVGTPSLSDVQLDALPLRAWHVNRAQRRRPWPAYLQPACDGLRRDAFGACRGLRQHLCPEARSRGGRDSGEHRQAAGQ